jgi:hypothetical protein
VERLRRAGGHPGQRILASVLLLLLLIGTANTAAAVLGVVGILQSGWVMRCDECGKSSREIFFSLPTNLDSDSTAAGTVLFHDSSQAPFGICLSLAVSLASPLAQIITPAVESQWKINTRYRSSRR